MDGQAEPIAKVAAARSRRPPPSPPNFFRNNESEKARLAERRNVIGAEFAAQVDIDRLLAKLRQNAFDQSGALALGIGHSFDEVLAG